MIGHKSHYPSVMDVEGILHNPPVMDRESRLTATPPAEMLKTTIARHRERMPPGGWNYVVGVTVVNLE